VGERNPDEVVVYTDSNKLLVRALGRDAIFDLAARRDYWDGEDTGLPKDKTVRSSGSVPSIAGAPATPKPPISSGDVEWHEADLGKGFFDRNRHLTYAAVGEDYHVGILIEAPPPGMRGAPRHYHMLEEEHALILDGEVTLLLGEERHEMKPGDYVCFPAGQAVGHSFLNSGRGPCSYLMIGERNPNDVCVMPDSKKMDVRALRPGDSIFGMSDIRDYLDDEPTD
ncbi:MAG: cupin domain-containing protein, partial [Parvibaculaceae bacterium]